MFATGNAVRRLDADGGGLRVDHQRLRLAVLELKRDLVGDQQRVERDDDAPGVERAEIGDRETGDVRNHQRHAVARMDSRRQQFAGKSARRLVQLGVRHPRTIADRGGQRRVAGGRIPQDRGEIQGHGIHDPETEKIGKRVRFYPQGPTDRK